jgi:hypothetical protein
LELSTSPTFTFMLVVGRALVSVFGSEKLSRKMPPFSAAPGGMASLTLNAGPVHRHAPDSGA